jgi:hypothetical protein
MTLPRGMNPRSDRSDNNPSPKASPIQGVAAGLGITDRLDSAIDLTSQFPTIGRKGA